jgi:radical SAM protein with 4Fe4S-binding SPASM domain
MEINKTEKAQFINFWKKQGIGVKIRPMVSWAGMIETSNLSSKIEERWPCHWAMQTMSILNDGRVVTCAVDLDAKFVVGNISYNSIKEIWGGKLKELRDLHTKGNFKKLPPHCRDCRDWQSARAEYY